MSKDDNPTEDDIESEDKLKEAFNYLFSGTEFEIKSDKPTPSSEEVTNRAMEIMKKRGMLNSTMSSEEEEEVKNHLMMLLNKLKGGARSSRKRRSRRSSRRRRGSKKSTRRRRRR